MSRVFRFAPSPTGRIHLGHVKAALFPYILSKKYGGELILRIEDTDKKRDLEGAVAMLIEDLKWLGINYDYGPDPSSPYKNNFFQSQRIAIYNKYIDYLLANDKAYPAYETPEERAEQIKIQRSKGQPPVYQGQHSNLTPEQRARFEAEGRKPVIRLRVPKDQIITFHDEVFGRIEVNTNQIGDIVIRKSDGTPMYNFCVVIDDHEMGVTDVVRGFGHLSNTAKQILIYKIFGWEPPRFAHFSDIQNENGSGKLSKRHGAKSIAQFRAEGYLPEAIINYVAYISCSWHFTDKDQEIMSFDEIVKKLDYSNILHTNAKFNSTKLDWFNGCHIRKLCNEEYVERVIDWLRHYASDNAQYDTDFSMELIENFLSNINVLSKGLMLVKERITKFKDILGYLRFLFYPVGLDQVDISPTKHTIEEFEQARQALYKALESLNRPWTHQEWDASIRKEADAMGWKHGDLFMALRLMIVGSPYSPPLFESMQILGPEECLRRIKK